MEKDPRSLQQPIQENTTYNTDKYFKPLAGQNMAYAEMRRSKAAKQLAAGDAANRMAENEQNGYQPYTSSGLGFIPKLKEPQELPSYQMTSKETINVYGDDGTGEPITVLNVEEMTSGFADAKMLQTGQRKHSKIVEEAIQLEKTKSIVVELIDTALDKLKSKRLEGKTSETSFTGSESSIPQSRMKQMKNSCFKKIEDELKLLKTLDRFSNDSE